MRSQPYWRLLLGQRRRLRAFPWAQPGRWRSCGTTPVCTFRRRPFVETTHGQGSEPRQLPTPLSQPIVSTVWQEHEHGICVPPSFVISVVVWHVNTRVWTVMAAGPPSSTSTVLQCTCCSSFHCVRRASDTAKGQVLFFFEPSTTLPRPLPQFTPTRRVVIRVNWAGRASAALTVADVQCHCR